MTIMLESKVQKIVKIAGRTQAKMFKDLKVGDKIKLSIPVNPPGGNRGTYASFITVRNLQTGEVAVKSFNQIDTILSCFEFAEEESR